MQSVPVCPLLLQSLQHESSLLLNFLPLGNQLIHIILFVQLSSHCLRIQLPTHKGHLLPIMFLATALLFAAAVPLIYSLPSCTFSARHLWVTVIFGRGFQVVFLHFAALFLQSLQHQSSLLLNFLPLGNQLIHIILCVQLSNHCLRIQLPTHKGYFPPNMFLATALLLAVVSCTSPRCCFSLFNISLPRQLTLLVSR